MLKSIQAAKGVCLFALGLSLWGCSKPHDPPHLEEPGLPSVSSFDGLLDLLPTEGSLRVFWTHGMCPHADDWAENRLQTLKTALPGFVEVPRADAVADGAPAHTVHRVLRKGESTIDLSFFIWSPLVDTYREALDYDSADVQGGIELNRGRINSMMKTGLMNDCLIDAVVYSGTSGDALRLATRKAACEVLGGAFVDPSTCNIASGTPSGALVFVSESLGSKLLFDAIDAITVSPDTSAASRSALQTQLATTRLVFLVANQIPLLDQAQPPASLIGPGADARTPASGQSSLSRFLGIVANARNSAARRGTLAAPLTLEPLPPVIAFSDPNDLLSYRLERKSVGDTENRLVNVIVSNDYTYLGLLENPLTAHCNYRVNPYVLGLIVHGYTAGEPVPEADAGESEACL